jgi:hypothetical protein
VGNCRVSTGYFNTITDALNAANQGDTINVCSKAGGYNEQVKITTPQLIVQGISSQGSSQVSVQPSDPQTVTSTVLGTQLAPLVWVAATGVTIKNIFTLNNAANAPPGVTVVGFYYASGASGTLNHVEANGAGVGIWVENSSTDIQGITIQNSVTTGFQQYGIVAASKQPANTIPVLGATISHNHVQDAIYGIYLYAVGGITSGNVITADGRFYQTTTATYGIWDAAPASVTGNTILGDSETATGIKIAAANASVTNNLVTSVANIAIDFSCLASTNVKGNTINAGYGIYHVPSTFTGTNTFFNTYKNRSGGC